MWQTTGNGPHVNVLKAYRKIWRGSLENGSGEECFGHSGRNHRHQHTLLLPPEMCFYLTDETFFLILQWKRHQMCFFISRLLIHCVKTHTPNLYLAVDTRSFSMIQEWQSVFWQSSCRVWWRTQWGAFPAILLVLHWQIVKGRFPFGLTCWEEAFISTLMVHFNIYQC